MVSNTTALSWAFGLGALAALAACGPGGESVGDVQSGAGDADDAVVDAAVAPGGVNAPIVTTETGLQYQVIKSGPETGVSPSARDVACVHYRGTLMDGTEFDSSYARDQAAAFPVSGVIAGWTEALQLMRPGDHWFLTIPSDLAYGERGAGDMIGPNATLQFEVELIDVRTSMPGPREDCADPGLLAQKRANLRAAEQYLSDNRAVPGVIETESGLQYRVVGAGPADGPTPEPGQWVCVHYTGTRIGGAEFDSSRARGQAAAFPSNQLIRGWVEALALMRPGDRWDLYIHPDLAYGDSARGDVIQANDLLIFDVEMIRLLDGPVERGVDCSAPVEPLPAPEVNLDLAEPGAPE